MRFIPLEEAEQAAAPAPKKFKFVPLGETEPTAVPPKQEVPAAAAVSLEGPPAPMPEARPWEPSLWEKFKNLLPSDRAKAANEALARRIAAEQKIPVEEAYRRMRSALGVSGAFGGRPSGQPMWNPEGRAPIQATAEAIPYVTEGVLSIPKGVAESALRMYRAGDIENAVDSGKVDSMVSYLGDEANNIFIPNVPKRLGMNPKDPNYQGFMGLGKSLGTSLTTMVASAASGAAATALTGSPLVGVAAGMGASGTLAYRSSKDEFLEKLRTKLNDDSKRVFGRPMNDAEWAKARKEFDSEAAEYGAWEAVPEAISNAIFLKAFAAPVKAARGARLAGYMNKAAAYAVENITETATGLGQNAVELRAGLTQNELTVVDAFKQQFIQTLLTTGATAAGAKGVRAAEQFYATQVLPRISPSSALAKAIEADLKHVGYTGAAQRSISQTGWLDSEKARAPSAIPVAPAGEAEPPSVYERIEPTFGATQTPATPAAPVAEERVEPTFGATQTPTPPPAAEERVEPTMGAPIVPAPPASAPLPDVERRTREIMATLPLSEEEARAIATAEVKRKLIEVDEVITKTPPAAEPRPTAATPEQQRLQDIYFELVDAGVPPAQAETLAREQFAAEQAEVVEEPVGAPNVARTVDTTGGVGAGVAGVPGAVSPAQGVGGAEPTGVVPPSTNVEQPAGGTTAPPGAVNPFGSIEAFAEAIVANDPRTSSPEAVKFLGDNLDAIDAAVQKLDAAAKEKTDALENDAASLGRSSADFAFDYAADYPSIQDAIDGARENIVDTFNERGITDEYLKARLIEAAQKAFDAEVQRRLGKPTEGTTDGAQAAQAQQAKAQGQETPAADATTPAAPEVSASDIVLVADDTPPVTKRGRGRPRKETTAQPAEGETAPKGKRGRPKLERTPEQQEKIAADKANQKSIVQMVDYHLKKLLEQLKSVPDMVKDFTPSVDFPTAQDFADYIRANIAAGILRLMQVPGVKGTEAYKRAKAVFDGPLFSDTNREDANIILKGEAQIRERASDQETYGQDEAGDEDSGASSARSRFLDGDVLYGAGPINPDLLTVTTGQGALNAIIRRGTPFQRFLARRLQGLVSDIRVFVVPEGFRPPTHLVPKNMWDNSVGVYSDPGKAIFLRAPSKTGDRLQGVNNVIALHELLHAATVRKIRLAMASTKDTALKRAVSNVTRAMAFAENSYKLLFAARKLPIEVVELVETLRRKDGESDIFSNPAEFLAYGLTDPQFQIFLMRSVVGKIKTTPFKQFISALMDMFGIGPQDTNAFKDLVLSTGTILRSRLSPEMLELEARGGYDDIETHAAAKPSPPSQQAVRSQKEIDAAYKKAVEGLAQSRASTLAKRMGFLARVRDEGSVLPILKDKYDTSNYHGRSLLVNATTFDFLARWFEKEVPAVRDTYNIMQKMLGHINELHQSAIDQITMFRQDFKGNPQLERDVTDAVLLSTVAKIDPSKRFARERQPDLDNRYQALGPVGQAAFKRIFDYHESLRGYMEFLLNKQIEDLPGLDPAIKDKLLASIYAKFAEERRIEPYVPLIREHGDYYLVVGRTDSKIKKQEPQVYFYKSREDRAADARRIAREQYGTDNVEQLESDYDFRMGADPRELRKYIDVQGTLLSELFNAIDSTVVPGTSTVDVNADLKDAMFNIWLGMMPEQGFRKHFAERKGRAGYHPDLTQNIAAHMTGMAPALARLRYGQQLRNQKTRFDATPEKYHPVRDAVFDRISSLLSPSQRGPLDAFAGVINKTVYLALLTGTATALVQPAGIYISGLPIISANHKANPAMVAAELTRALGSLATGQFGITRTLPNGEIEYVAPTLSESKTLTGDELAAMKAMGAMNVASQTYSGFLWDSIDGAPAPSVSPETAAGKAYAVGKKAGDIVINGLLRNTERITREVVFLASYRVGRKQGLNHEQAIMQAASDVKESLGDYDMRNKPKWMQHPIGRVAFAMKTYPVVVTQQLIGSLAKALPFLNKEGKAQAITKFTGIMMMTAVLAGTYNMPFADAIISLLTKFLDDLDDDDLPEDLKSIDPVTWFKLVYMPRTLGPIKILGKPLDRIIGEGALGTFLNTDIGRRIGLNDMWFRDGKPSKSVPEAVGTYMLAVFGGPALGYGKSFLNGIESALIGDYEKAFEQMVPLAPARNVAAAVRVSKEGFQAPKGEYVPPEKVTKADVVRQAMGISPADVAAAREASFKLTGAEQQVVNKRDLITRRLKHAFDKDKMDLLDKVLEEEIPKFNSRHPEYRITREQVIRMAKELREQKARAVAGVPITKKNAQLLGEPLDIMERRLRERE